MELPEKMSLESLDIAGEKRERLKELLRAAFPEANTEDKIDVDQLKRVLGEWVEPPGPERFGLTWPGKADCMRVIQQPSIATLKPLRDQSLHFDDTENLFIEGDNLEVLKLLQKSYFGKVKMIYIDPPYNTGKEFIYPDNYGETLQTYLEYTGQKDGEGRKFSTNTEQSGRYHSNWLKMMYPRLYLAKNLLRDDGVIFISIDDNEQAHLRQLCDQIFGEENFVGDVIWNSTQSVTNTALISVSHTYNLIYAKNLDYFTQNRHHFRLPEDGSGFGNPDGDPRGPWKADPFQVGGWRPNQQYEIKNPKTDEIFTPNPGCSWKNDYVKFQTLLADNRIVFGESGEAGPQRKRFLFEAKKRGKVEKTWWDKVGTTSRGTKILASMFDDKNMFSNPKPIDLIKKMVLLGDHTKNGIILDFFAGSCTTAHAVMQLNAEDGGNRRFICVQLPEPCDEQSEARKAGYQTIADIGKERIRRAAEKIATETAQKNQGQLNLNGGTPLDLGFKVFKLAPSNFKIWNGYATHPHDKNWREYTQAEKEAIENELITRLEDHIDHIDKTASPEDILYELLLKSGFPLTTAIERRQMPGGTAYFIEDGAMIICLEKKLTLELIDAIAQERPFYVICLDEGFQGNDQLKVNAVHSFKSGLHAPTQGQETIFRTV